MLFWPGYPFANSRARGHCLIRLAIASAAKQERFAGPPEIRRAKPPGAEITPTSHLKVANTCIACCDRMCVSKYARNLVIHANVICWAVNEESGICFYKERASLAQTPSNSVGCKKMKRKKIEDVVRRLRRKSRWEG